MSVRKRLLLLAPLLFILSACSTTTKSNDDEADIKIKTAKINAQLGIAYLQRSNIQRAKQKLLLSLDQAPNIPEPWYAMGYFLEATGNRDQASTYYLKAVEIAPNRGDVQNNYGTYLCRGGQYRSAIQHFMLAVQDHNYLDPADAYENAGSCAMKIPNYREANHYFNMALKEDPSRASSQLSLAELNYKIGNYKKARLTLQTYLLSSPANAETTHLASLIDTKLLPVQTPPIAVASKKVQAKPMTMEDLPVETPTIAVTAYVAPIKTPVKAKLPDAKITSKLTASTITIKKPVKAPLASKPTTSTAMIKKPVKVQLASKPTANTALANKPAKAQLQASKTPIKHPLVNKGKLEAKRTPSTNPSISPNKTHLAANKKLVPLQSLGTWEKKVKNNPDSKKRTLIASNSKPDMIDPIHFLSSKQGKMIRV